MYVVMLAKEGMTNSNSFQVKPTAQCHFKQNNKGEERCSFKYPNLDVVSSPNSFQVKPTAQCHFKQNNKGEERCPFKYRNLDVVSSLSRPPTRNSG